MKNNTLKVSVAFAYVAMIVVNFLANSLPLNNRSTGDISDAYQNLFAPAGLTFSIWGLIYLLLAMYVIYQFTRGENAVIMRINKIFIINALLNIAWIFAWHYDFIWASLLIMLGLLVTLIKIADIIRVQSFSPNEKILVRLPFSIYFGWITVATIANFTVFFVSIGWNGFGIADYIWTIAILLIGALIGISRMLYDKNLPYGLVLVWAYIGILIKHLSVNGFDALYPSVIVTIILCLVVYLLFMIKIAYENHDSIGKY